MNDFTGASRTDLQFLWLEITGKCQETCGHCYADSGPNGTHGMMAEPDWLRVIDQAAGLGVRMIQLIGGEPTLHPSMPTLLAHALDVGLEVEVFSNLLIIRPELWDLFARDGVSLACSYYSDDPGQHDAITHRRGSHRRTRDNIARAVTEGINLRVGVIDLDDEQRWRQAVDDLTGLGVPEGRIGVDQLRQVGRGIRTEGASPDQLCGQCTAGVGAVLPDGSVFPCVFSRWLPAGNVLTDDLGTILAGGLAERRAYLDAAFSTRPEITGCNPTCGPNCNPIGCGPRCQPMTGCNPAKQCAPASNFCPPNYRGPGTPCSPRSDCAPKQCNPTATCNPKTKKN
ncbi:hypothetical protein Lfu02_15280 [Longispora fulva]|uniref:MoaA/NifB/PqqE/SkfB family radical SAM enzyme n=1 Tax=Longispora fulva TaxID=619741 RepID=A0A8J7KZ86_9ACTN|nr:radical SAM/SPASM domain-containing protein [Longispora fulva]MBG6140462.1 MoaA/NifB/PqqE/SkfB family radical SAM enzyme [Longispora fulva]GIG57156.1 hypothetical protein Lfu02_15280 [Longispora fulva]